jgi:CRISPR-associated protein Cas5d
LEVATRIGGEKFSYQVPTYQALKGITESIYWKPTFIWVIDGVRVMNKIQTEGKGVRTIVMKPKKKDVHNDLSYYTYLKDVRYQVRAHFEWNEQRQDLAQDRNENKHHNIAKRSLVQGGRRDIFLGTRECQGYVEPCSFGSDEGFYDGYGEMSLGYMFYGFSYPDENSEHNFIAKFWRPVMDDGVITFARPDAPSLDYNVIREQQTVKNFVIGDNFSLAQE